MPRASISALKARLSEYLRAVKNGEDVIVTERGKPIARLVPLDHTETHDAHVQRLIEAGLVRPAEGELADDFWDRPRPKDPEGLSLQALLEERTQSR